MIPMKVLGLTLDSHNNAPILVLQQEDGAEILPIWIGTAEALSISVALNNTPLDRPLTHETMHQALEALGAVVKAVDLTSLRDGTYYAELEIAQPDQVVRLDCRPSDGIALALRCNAPIRVAPPILEETAANRTRQRGEDLVTAFVPEEPDDKDLELLLQNMEPVSRFKM